jgi:hypothetical protein
LLGPAPVFLLRNFVFGQSGDHPLEDFAKYGCKPDMKYKSLIIPLFSLATTLKTKYRNLMIFTNFFPSHLVIKSLQNHFIFKNSWANFHQ